MTKLGEGSEQCFALDNCHLNQTRTFGSIATMRDCFPSSCPTVVREFVIYCDVDDDCVVGSHNVVYCLAVGMRGR